MSFHSRNLFPELLPNSKLRRVTLSSGEDGRINIQLSVNVIAKQTDALIRSTIPGFAGTSYSSDIFGGSESQLPNIRDYIDLVVVANTNPTEEFQEYIFDPFFRANAVKLQSEVTEYWFGEGNDKQMWVTYGARDEGDLQTYVARAFKNTEINHWDWERFRMGEVAAEETLDLQKSQIAHTINWSMSQRELGHLTISTFCYFNFEDFISTIPEIAEFFSEESNLALSVSNFGSHDHIFRNGDIVGEAHVFMRPDGTQHTGPYHTHEKEDGTRVFMEGSAHSDSAHAELTRLIVPNNKIQDFRSVKRFEPQPYVPNNRVAQGLNEAVATLRGIQSEFSKKENIFDHSVQSVMLGEGVSAKRVSLEAVAGYVSIDQALLLQTHSKLGFLFPYLSPQQKSFALWWCDMFRLVEAKIFRRKLSKRPKMTDHAFGIGVTDSRPFEPDSPEQVVASNGELIFDGLGSITDSSVLRRDGTLRIDDDSYYNHDGLMRGTNSTIGYLDDINAWPKNTSIGSTSYVRYKNNFNTTEYGTSLEASDVFPWVRLIEFRHGEVDDVAVKDQKGFYEYGIELTYEDGLIKYMYELVTKMKSLAPKLNILARHLDSGNGAVTASSMMGTSQGLTYGAIINDVISTYIDACTILRGFYTSRDVNRGIQAEHVFELLPELKVSRNQADQALQPQQIKNLFTNALNEANTPEERIVALGMINEFATSFGVIATAMADISSIPDVLYSNETPDVKASAGGKAPPLIKVKKILGTVNFGNEDLPTMSILPEPSYTLSSPLPTFSQDDLRTAIELEAVKFGGDTADYASGLAYFTPNRFSGSKLLDLYTMMPTAVNPSTRRSYGSSITYDKALKALQTVVDAKRKKIFNDANNALTSLALIFDTSLRDKTRSRLEEDLKRALNALDEEHAAKKVLLNERRIAGEFLDEDLTAARSFAELNLDAKLEMVDIVGRVLSDNRQHFTNYDEMTTQEIQSLAAELFAKKKAPPGVGVQATLLGINLPDQQQLPPVDPEAECAALSESAMSAMINNERRSLTMGIVKAEFAELQAAFDQSFNEFVDATSEATEDASFGFFTAQTRLDTSIVKDAVFQHKLDQAAAARRAALQAAARQIITLPGGTPETEAEKARQQYTDPRNPFLRTISTPQQPAEKKNSAEAIKKAVNEEEARKNTDASDPVSAQDEARQKAQPEQPIPFQLRRVASGETDFGISENGAGNSAIYGNFYLLQRETRVRQGWSSVLTYIPVTIADALDGLEPGKYRFIPYEGRCLKSSPNYALEITEFIVARNPDYDEIERQLSSAESMAKLNNQRYEKLFNPVTELIRLVGARNRGELATGFFSNTKNLIRKAKNDIYAAMNRPRRIEYLKDEDAERPIASDQILEELRIRKEKVNTQESEVIRLREALESGQEMILTEYTTSPTTTSSNGGGY